VNSYWIACWIAFAVIAMWFAWCVLARGEVVGDMRCRMMVGSQTSRVRLIVKRSVAGQSGIPLVELQSRITMRLYSTPLQEGEALHLAQLLDEAGDRLRTP
jgi:hypothetical protein